MISASPALDKVWGFFSALGVPAKGIAGLMGNLYAESACDPTTVEMLLAQRYDEDGRQGYLRPVTTHRADNNARYCQEIDAGTIDKVEFLSPRGKRYGFGLAQWTLEDRKERLWDLAEDDGKKVYDLDVQLDFLYYELVHSYPSVWDAMRKAESVQAVSDIVLQKFECPAGWQALRATRAQYGEEILALYDKVVSTTGYDKSKILAVAKAEVGYLEKNDKSDLDSKTGGHVGGGNYTKYWRDLGLSSWQGQAWCDAFVKWCFMTAYGKSHVKELTCGGDTSFYTPTSAQYYKKAGRYDMTPQVGDQVFFKNSVRIHHTGLVYKVDSERIYTVEGNTSDGTAVIANGGGVCKKSYLRTNVRIAGYGHPKYGVIEQEEAKVGASIAIKVGVENVRRGSTGTSVLLLQEILKARGFYSGGLTWSCDKALVDAVKAYQKSRSGVLSVDGECGPRTWADLLGM